MENGGAKTRQLSLEGCNLTPTQKYILPITDMNGEEYSYQISSQLEETNHNINLPPASLSGREKKIAFRSTSGNIAMYSL